MPWVDSCQEVRRLRGVISAAITNPSPFSLGFMHATASMLATPVITLSNVIVYIWYFNHTHYYTPSAVWWYSVTVSVKLTLVSVSSHLCLTLNHRIATLSCIVLN